MLNSSNMHATPPLFKSIRQLNAEAVQVAASRSKTLPLDVWRRRDSDCGRKQSLAPPRNEADFMSEYISNPLVPCETPLTPPDTQFAIPKSFVEGNFACWPIDSRARRTGLEVNRGLISRIPVRFNTNLVAFRQASLWKSLNRIMRARKFRGSFPSRIFIIAICWTFIFASTSLRGMQILKFMNIDERAKLALASPQNWKADTGFRNYILNQFNHTGIIYISLSRNSIRFHNEHFQTTSESTHLKVGGPQLFRDFCRILNFRCFQLHDAYFGNFMPPLYFRGETEPPILMENRASLNKYKNWNFPNNRIIKNLQLIVRDTSHFSYSTKKSKCHSCKTIQKISRLTQHNYQNCG